MLLTDKFLSMSNRLSVAPEVSDPTKQWSMFNDAGTEVEVSEFLYNLVRLIKPTNVLETGTHVGVSSSYMAQGLKENGKGKLITCEVNTHLLNQAQALWRDLEVSDWIESRIIVPTQGLNENIENLNDPQPELNELIDGKEFDLVFLDSEPQLRYSEFVKYFDKVRPGGFILIHDLHANLGFSEAPNPDWPQYHSWPWGDFRIKLGSYLKSHDVQVVSFGTPRGFTLFQKAAPNFSYTKHLKGEM